MRNYGDQPEKLDPRDPLSGSLKVTGTNTDQSATYDFLLVINDNHWHLVSRTISEVYGDFGRKLQIFLTQVFNARTEGVPAGIL